MVRKLSIVILFLTLLSSTTLSGQFIEGMEVAPPGSTRGEENWDDSTYVGVGRESYTLKRYFKSLAGKDSMSISRMWAGSLLLPGTAQIYNKQYWKVPVLYLSVGGLAAAGYSYNQKWHNSGEIKYKRERNLFYTAAALVYWSGILDGVANYKYEKKVLPGRASLYSAMVPGLGQIYNRDYWKLPIYYGGFIASGYFIVSNHSQYQHYKNLYYTSSDKAHPNSEKYNPQTMKYYMDAYRRYRDYSILAGILVYALNVIDANVFAHLQDFDVSDDLAASFNGGVGASVIGLQLSFKF